jgi:hypothetical protein
MGNYPETTVSHQQEISTPPAISLTIGDCWLEYTKFMKIGQPKLSERTGQRGGLFVTPATILKRSFRKLAMVVQICLKKTGAKWPHLYLLTFTIVAPINATKRT